ncbi:transcriptional regulator, RpiR family [Sporobacter termitidis DSM 10068]|uniref:Transcriptional regulator, RpiR family n=1 Tax=Sporobacter termitidis DSM 10068 TaxID=1123282 RepID=A0A1M5XBN7_9FIRM|nr:MurR/RpiR family transcriptional regulator [Sporobacter termitidis]SHH96978.1 transcriptional regulator, RpiR family [Sporobacter termitidis DSM 10068]
MNKDQQAAKDMDLSVESLQERIDRVFDQLTPAQQKATIYIRKKWEQICFMTAREVGQKAEVSEATIQRIAVCLGFESFRDMKMKMKNSLLRNRAVVNFKLKGAHEPGKAGWLDEHVSAEVGNIVQTFRLNSNEVLEKGARMLIGAQRVWVIGDRMGSGASAYLCFSLNYLIGKTVQLNKSNCYEYLSLMNENDALLIIGFQRYSKSTLRIAELAKKRGVRVLVFTDCDLSPFAKLADVAFFAVTDSIIFLDSYSSVLSLAQALISKLVKLEQQAVRRNIESTEEIYGLLKE